MKVLVRSLICGVIALSSFHASADELAFLEPVATCKVNGANPAGSPDFILYLPVSEAQKLSEGEGIAGVSGVVFLGDVDQYRLDEGGLAIAPALSSDSKDARIIKGRFDFYLMGQAVISVVLDMNAMSAEVDYRDANDPSIGNTVNYLCEEPQ